MDEENPPLSSQALFNKQDNLYLRHSFPQQQKQRQQSRDTFGEAENDDPFQEGKLGMVLQIR
ncbi:hypothetical protein CCACVL1_22880 [Corchorus capsularis]|uniref:Uncharacterized protein n=1 Tax=Corchorus capsularis TaxID=210143 RepID=A0A1R3GW70_COCAP|nr:hypothetical protein CCACVL1_22880 [Corchorus capsularis]